MRDRSIDINELSAAMQRRVRKVAGPKVATPSSNTTVRTSDLPLTSGDE